VEYSPSYEDVIVSSRDFTRNRSTTPHGGGRFVRNSFFRKYYRKYPTIVGYESEIIGRHKRIQGKSFA
jgi:hypothetical protein